MIDEMLREARQRAEAAAMRTSGCDDAACGARATNNDVSSANDDRGDMALQIVEATAGSSTAGDGGSAATGSGLEQKKRKIRRRAQNEASHRQRQDAASKGADGKEGEGPALLACEM